jgi:pullulanase/glycogen debranching enzyme
MTGHFERFRDFKTVYNRHTCSQVNPTTGEIDKNFNGICINNSIGCLDWNVADWFQEETQLLCEFLESMKTLRDDTKLPAPAKNQNLKEITPKMVSDVKGATPQVHQGISKETQLAPESWNQLKTAAKDPLVFLTHPRNLIKYLPVKEASKKDVAKKG